MPSKQGTLPFLLGAVFYVPSVALLLCVGLAFLIPPKTRLFGKRLIYATLATAPALVASRVVGVVSVFIITVPLSLIARPWTHDGQVTNVFVGGLLAFSLLGVFLLAAAFVVASVAAGWRVGWKMASGARMREVIEADPLLRRLGPWRKAVWDKTARE